MGIHYHPYGAINKPQAKLTFLNFAGWTDEVDSSTLLDAMCCPFGRKPEIYIWVTSLLAVCPASSAAGKSIRGDSSEQWSRFHATRGN